MTNKKIKTAKRKNQNFFSQNFKEGLQYIKQSRNFIYVASAIFILFIFVGYFVPAPQSLEKVILKFIEDLIKTTEGMSWTELTNFILFNNLKSSFFGMALGVVFGIFSVLTTLANGYLLGFVSSRIVGTEGIAILWKLFPHGIFEIPAMLISVGLGLKLGTFIFKKKKFESLKEYSWKSLKAFFFVVVPLLVVAALIEGTLIIFFG
ncbi:MAG: stage II sporulation protein M [Nanoarchaeota archaeon]